VSASNKLPIDFAQDESFSAAINIVRQLSEGTIHRDPSAKIIPAEKKPTNIRPFPARQILNPRIRIFKPLSEWQVRQIGYAARTGRSLADVQREQSARRQERRIKAKAGQ
jgi:hypothetical protein